MSVPADRQRRARAPADREAVEAYLAALPEAARAGLAILREQLLALVPEASEGLNYGVPVLRLPSADSKPGALRGAASGPVLLGYGAGRDHLALYLFDGDTIALLAALVADPASRVTGAAKGTLRFAIDAPPPAALLSALIDARRRALAATATR